MKTDIKIESVKISDMRMIVNPYPIFLKKNGSINDIAKALIATPRLKSVYIVNDRLKLIGKVDLKKLIKNVFRNLIPSSFGFVNALDFVGDTTIEDLMDEPTYVKDNDTLKTAFVKMYENDLDELPVVNDKLNLIGIIDSLELLTILLEQKEQKAGKEYLTITSNRPFHKRFR